MVFGVCAFFGFPSLGTLMQWSSASQRCTSLAEEKKAELFFGSEKTVRALDSWIARGKVVVEIVGIGGSEQLPTYLPRICLVNSDSIEIVSLLENQEWR